MSALCSECGAPLPPDGICAVCTARAADAASQGTTRQSPSSVLERPDRIGVYKILDTLGEGGMGVVYLAEQERPFRRRVALKIIKIGMDTREVIARFEAERQALALMDHPNIAQVHDAGATDDGRPYFVMEHVPGISITEYCDKHLLSTRARLELFMQVCSAIQHAHQKGIIHRDIKPSNILVMVQDRQLVPKVIDFGVAKATHQRLTEKTVFTQLGLLIGTPEYMSPEQAEMGGLNVDTTTDIYSLGVLLYELLVGALPFDRDRLRSAAYHEIQRIIREEEPHRPSTRLSGLGHQASDVAKKRNTEVPTLQRELKGDLDWIVMRAMDKDRIRRYPSASEFALDIARHLAGDTVLARPTSNAYRLRKIARRHRAAVATALIVIVALSAGLVVSMTMFFRASVARREAERQSYAATLAAVDAMISTVESSRSRTSRPRMSSSLGLVDDAERRLARVPMESRGWEWNYLMARFDGSLATLWGVAPTTSVRATTMSGPGETFRQPTYQGRFGISNDGTEVFWATEQGVHAWTFQNGQFSGAWDGHGRVLALSDDGSRVLSTDDRLSRPVRVIAVKSGETLAVLEESSAYAFRQAVFSPNNSYIATEFDGVITIWESTGQKRISVSINPHIPVMRFAVGTPLLIIGSNSDLYTWHFASASPPIKIAGDGNARIFDGDVSGDGTMAVTLDEARRVRWWRIGAQTSMPGGQHNGAGTVAISPNGFFAATGGSDGVVRLWGPPFVTMGADGEVGTLDPHDETAITNVRFAKDESRVVTGSQGGVLRQWDANRSRLATGVGVRLFPSLSASVLADGGRFALINDLSSGTLIDVESLQAQSTEGDHYGVGTTLRGFARVVPNGKPDEITAAAVHSDGTKVVLSRADGTILQWSPRKPQAPATLAKEPASVSSLAMSRRGRHVAAVSSEAGRPRQPLSESKATLLRVWNLDTLQEVSRFSVEVEAGKVVFGWEETSLVIIPFENRVKPVCKDVIKIVTLLGGGIATVPECANDAAINPDGTIVTHSLKDGRIRRWSSTGKAISESIPIRDVQALTVNPDGTRVAVRAAAGIQILETATLQLLFAISATGSFWGAPAQLQFTDDGSRLVELQGGQLRAFDARPNYRPEVRVAVREAMESRGAMLATEREARLEQDSTIQSAVKPAAIAEIRRIGDRDVVVLCSDSAEIVRRADASLVERERALRHAAKAVELAPWSAFCVSTLGMSKYRLQDHTGAVEALRRAIRVRGEARPLERAFEAMALKHLGRVEEAVAIVDELRRADLSLQSELKPVLSEFLSMFGASRLLKK